MKTAIKATLIVTAVIIVIQAGLLCKQQYSRLQLRYAPEAKGQAQGFITSLMY